MASPLCNNGVGTSHARATQSVSYSDLVTQKLRLGPKRERRDRVTHSFVVHRHVATIAGFGHVELEVSLPTKIQSLIPNDGLICSRP